MACCGCQFQIVWGPEEPPASISGYFQSIPIQGEYKPDLFLCLTYSDLDMRLVGWRCP